VTDFTERLEQTWESSGEIPTWAKELLTLNVVLTEKVRLLTPLHTPETLSRVRLAIEAIDREFGEFLVSREGGE
jgi:hypothetical protein